jgi:hypothetical protein
MILSDFISLSSVEANCAIRKYRILVGKPVGKSPLGRPRCRWVDKIKMDLREIGGVGWMTEGPEFESR